jgi:voltage-gated potassium channel Kch
MTESSDIDTAAVGAFSGAYFCRRYAILFYTLLATLVAAPLLTALQLRGVLIEFLLAANLLAAVMPSRSAGSRRVLLIATVLVWIARPLAAWFDHPALSVLALGLWTAIALFAAGGALRFAMSGQSIDAEHLYAALSSYLLAGIFFGLFYWAVAQIAPETFNVETEFTRMTALYFSFVTLATLGYGDIVPRTDVARGIAIVEGVGGQLFLAVLVARLVSLYGRRAQ